MQSPLQYGAQPPKNVVHKFMYVCMHHTFGGLKACDGRPVKLHLDSATIWVPVGFAGSTRKIEKKTPKT